MRQLHLDICRSRCPIFIKETCPCHTTRRERTELSEQACLYHLESSQYFLLSTTISTNLTAIAPAPLSFDDLPPLTSDQVAEIATDLQDASEATNIIHGIASIVKKIYNPK